MANTIDLGLVTAYGNAKEGGYTGTESQFNTLLANLPTYASNAAASATAAAASAVDANDAADRAEAIVGGQFVSYGQAQGLSDTQKAQARANISAGASNRNLLDNPWWGSGEVVNQRGMTGTPANQAYCIDRWIYSTDSGSNAISLGANGITFTPVSGQYMWMIQRRQNANALLGKKVTGSILLSNGTIYSGAVTVTTGNDYMYFDNTVGFSFYLDTSNNVVLRVGGSAKTIRAVKLELGSYSTLANDVPPNYGEELRKCQYYFRRITVQDNGFIALGWATSATAAQFPNILGTSPMRAKPTATPTGAVYVRDPSGTDHAVSSFTVQYDPVTVCLQANTSGLTANTVARLRIGAGGRIDLSADL